MNQLNSLKNNKVLITGAAGTLGSSIARHCVKLGAEAIYLLDINESALYLLQQELIASNEGNSIGSIEILLEDIRNHERIESIFRFLRPNIVFHAAAYKHVPVMEDNPDISFKVNFKATQDIALQSLKNKVRRFVFISTDKANRPSSVMGACKLLAERYLESLNQLGGATKFISIRSGNILGSNGSVVPLFNQQIRNGGPVTITDENCTRYFIELEGATDLILKALRLLDGGRYIINSARLLKIKSIAEELIRESGKDSIDIKFIGLRNGERLHEQIKPQESILSETPIPEVLRIVEADNYRLTDEQIARLGYASAELDKNSVKDFLKVLLPDYQ